MIASTLRASPLLSPLLVWAAATGELSALPAPASAQAAGATVVVVPIEGQISEKMVALTVRAIRVAHEQQATAVVFEIDTPGGDVELMDRVIDELERAEELTTVAFVTQKAASAGALIAISCQRLYMKPQTNIGSAFPILMTAPGLLGSREDLSSERAAILEKHLSHLRGHFRAKAQANGRSPALAEAMVDPDVGAYEIELDGVRQFATSKDLVNLATEHGEASIRKLRDVCRQGEILNLTSQEAVEARFIDGLAASRRDLFDQLGMSDVNVIEITPTWSEHLVEIVQGYGWLLLAVGLIAVFMEMKLPGFGLPGVIGIVCIGLYLFGKYLAGLAEGTEILLIVLGFALIAVELFVVPGTLISGVLGALAILAGIVLASQQTVLPNPERPFAAAAWWANVRAVSLALTGSVAAAFLVAHYFPHIPLLNRAMLRNTGGSTSAARVAVAAERPPSIGARGTASTVLRPAGKIEIAGRELDAISEGAFVESGRTVVVVRLDSGNIVVRADDSPAA